MSLSKRLGPLPGVAPGIWQDDSRVPASLTENLKKHVESLRNVPDDQKDWHPGTDQQALDLVHPSMFPLRYGGPPLTDANGELGYLDPPALDTIRIPDENVHDDGPVLTLSERAGEFVR